ncbi:MarR family transcriptional regulator [Porifericola rhodea]|uniref:MarR family winged helix-turn-helix transcriptional regulator n=1 Tax=Porifericola rhodea TaxID=930972 RepID=UPI0026653CFD|nr:MarR family transcriptional regulator [Porifericola rhodea]WKN32826.1 MarR family transcriptional regulator [Porifericola rhodea]
MKLEEEIHQPNFYNKHHKLRINLLYTFNWFRAQIKSFLDQYELTQQQFNVLRILRGSFPDPISTKEITRRSVDRYTDSSRVVDRLLKKGLVKKENCPNDKRLVHVTITSQGLELLLCIDKQMDGLDNITKNLNEEQIDQLNTLLDTLRGEDRLDKE